MSNNSRIIERLQVYRKHLHNKKVRTNEAICVADRYFPRHANVNRLTDLDFRDSPNHFQEVEHNDHVQSESHVATCRSFYRVMESLYEMSRLVDSEAS